MEQELITEHQAGLLMLAVLIAAPVIGVLWGAVVKRWARGLTVGLLVGGGNYALWTVYNAITDRLGLDTVKNLLVNLGLFLVIGVLVGLALGRYAGRQPPPPEGDQGT